MALSQKEIKRIEVMELLAGGKWFCPQIRRAPTLSLRRVDVDFLFAHREMRNTNSRLIWIASPERGGVERSEMEGCSPAHQQPLSLAPSGLASPPFRGAK